MNRKEIFFTTAGTLLLLFAAGSVPSAHAMGAPPYACEENGLAYLYAQPFVNQTAVEAQTNYYQFNVISFLITYQDALDGGRNVTYNAVTDPNATIYVSTQDFDAKPYAIGVKATIRMAPEGSEAALGYGAGPGFTAYGYDDGEFPNMICMGWPSYPGTSASSWVYANETLTLPLYGIGCACGGPIVLHWGFGSIDAVANDEGHGVQGTVDVIGNATSQSSSTSSTSSAHISSSTTSSATSSSTSSSSSTIPNLQTTYANLATFEKIMQTLLHTVAFIYLLFSL